MRFTLTVNYFSILFFSGSEMRNARHVRRVKIVRENERQRQFSFSVRSQKGRFQRIRLQDHALLFFPIKSFFSKNQFLIF